MCQVCDRIEQIRQGKNPCFVRETETGYVVMGDYQHFEGYTLFLCREHKIELYELEEAFKMRFLKEMSLVALAVQRAFGADKMNYELLGNNADTHLHWHLFPRKDGDLEEYGSSGRGPVWWYPREKMYADWNRPSEHELNQLKKRLASELDKVMQ